MVGGGRVPDRGGEGDVADGGGDCDDTNPEIHPGADEWCDSVGASGVLRHDGVAELLLAYSSTDDQRYLLMQREWNTGTWGLDDVTGDGWVDVTLTTNDGVWLFTPFDDIPWDEASDGD